MRLVLLVAALACLVVSASASAELKLDYPGAYDDSAPAEKRGSGPTSLTDAVTSLTTLAHLWPSAAETHAK